MHALHWLWSVVFLTEALTTAECLTNEEFFNLIKDYATDIETFDIDKNSTDDEDLEYSDVLHLPGDPDDLVDFEYLFESLGFLLTPYSGKDAGSFDEDSSSADDHALRYEDVFASSDKEGVDDHHEYPDILQNKFGSVDDEFNNAQQGFDFSQNGFGVPDPDKKWFDHVHESYDSEEDAFDGEGQGFDFGDEGSDYTENDFGHGKDKPDNVNESFDDTPTDFDSDDDEIYNDIHGFDFGRKSFGPRNYNEEFENQKDGSGFKMTYFDTQDYWSEYEYEDEHFYNAEKDSGQDKKFSKGDDHSDFEPTDFDSGDDEFGYDKQSFEYDNKGFEDSKNWFDNYNDTFDYAQDDEEYEYEGEDVDFDQDHYDDYEADDKDLDLDGEDALRQNESEACLQIAYVPRNYGFRLTFTVNGHRLFSHEISLKHPPALCWRVPGFGSVARVCLELYDVNLYTKHVCARITGVINLKFKKFRVHLKLGCFRIPISDKDAFYLMMNKQNAREIKYPGEKPSRDLMDILRGRVLLPNTENLE